MFMHCLCFEPRTTDTDEHFVAYKVHQTKTETLYYTGFTILNDENKNQKLKIFTESFQFQICRITALFFYAVDFMKKNFTNRETYFNKRKIYWIQSQQTLYSSEE